jgi:hypothetical protein
MIHTTRFLALIGFASLSACDSQNQPDDTAADTATGVHEADPNDAARHASCASNEMPVTEDEDGDGWGAIETPVCVTVVPAGKSARIGDCDDNDSGSFPGAQEQSNGWDDDCDGLIDEAQTTSATCYVDADNDGHRLATSFTSPDADCESNGEAYFSEPMGDCDDAKASVNVDRAEVLNNGVDDDCNTQTSDTGAAVYYKDGDLDGYGNASGGTSSVPSAGFVANNTDCNDSNAAVNPAASDLTVDGTDQNCDGKDGVSSGTYTFYKDVDADGFGNLSSPTTVSVNVAPAGYVANSTDCNDSNAAVKPGATEVCNSIDDNCVNGVDEGNVCTTGSTWYRDADGDLFGSASVFTVQVSQPAGYVASATDCNDANAAIKPGAVEICDAVDNNCVSGVDEGNVCSTSVFTFYKDADSDGYGNAGQPTTVNTNAAPVGYVSDKTDCDDTKSTVHPNATEIRGDEVDQDCTGTEVCYIDLDDDTYRSTLNLPIGSADVDCADAFEAKASDPQTDCDDVKALIHPGAIELVGDEVDQNCDGVELCLLDNDDDGYRTSSAGQIASPNLTCADPFEAKASDPTTDCDDAHASAHPGGSEVCGNSIDEDCVSGDQTCAATCYADADNDGVRTDSTVAGNGDSDCDDTGEANASEQSGDCDDSNAAVKPGATEVCNSIDDNCASGVDEGNVCTTPPGTFTWYRDADSDTYGSAQSQNTTTNVAPPGFVSRSGDCNDANSTFFPGAPDSVDGFDQNCDGADGISSVTRSTFTWTFTLDSAASAMTLDQFEVKNTTAGTTTSAFQKSGSVVSVSVTSRTSDVLSLQCWLNGGVDWCASNLHGGHIVSATGPTGAYSVGQNTGDLRYVADGNGKRYGGSVK